MKWTNAIFKLMVGASIFVFALSALIYSTSASYAEVNTQTPTFLPAEGNQGKFTLQYQCGLDGNSKFYWQMIVFNSETTAYKAFRWDRDSQTWKPLFADCIAFPSIP